MSKLKIIYSLQIARIFAAFVVMLFHINSIFATKFGTNEYFTLFNFGRSGVHIFFVLSGFVMYWVHRKDIGQGLEAGRKFAWKRFIRIYPTYWILTTLVVFAMFLTSGEVKGFKQDPFYIFQSYALVEMGFMQGSPIIPAGWTLFHEIKFYAFFMLLILVRHKGIRLALILSALSLTLFQILAQSWLVAAPVFGFYFSDFNLLFAAGVLSGWITENHHRYLASKWYVLLSLAAYAAFSILCNIYLWRTSTFTILVYGLIGFLIITTMSCYETHRASVRGESPFKLNNFMLLLADTTYCLYLIHYPLYTMVAIVVNRLGMDLPDLSVISFMIAAAFAVSLAYYKTVEYPLTRKLKNAMAIKRRALVPK